MVETFDQALYEEKTIEIRTMIFLTLVCMFKDNGIDVVHTVFEHKNSNLILNGIVRICCPQIKISNLFSSGKIEQFSNIQLLEV